MQNDNAAWYYPQPKPAAAEIKDPHRVFWNGRPRSSANPLRVPASFLLRDLILEYRSIVHHKPHVLQFHGVLQRISGHPRSLPRTPPGSDHPDLSLHVQHLRRSRMGRRLNRVHRRHPQRKPILLNSCAHRFRPRNPAHVRFHKQFSGCAFSAFRNDVSCTIAPWRRVALSLQSVRRRPVVVVWRKCRAIPRPLPLHLRDLRGP